MTEGVCGVSTVGHAADPRRHGTGIMSKVTLLSYSSLDDRLTWRIILRTDPDAIVILDVFAKKTPTTPTHIIEHCRRRLRAYDAC